MERKRSKGWYIWRITKGHTKSDRDCKNHARIDRSVSVIYHHFNELRMSPSVVIINSKKSFIFDRNTEDRILFYFEQKITKKKGGGERKILLCSTDIDITYDEVSVSFSFFLFFFPHVRNHMMKSGKKKRRQGLYILRQTEFIIIDEK